MIVELNKCVLSHFCKRGYESLLEHYQKVSPLLNEPLYTRTVQGGVLKKCLVNIFSERASLQGGGVRGVPHQRKLMWPYARL